MSVPVSLPAFTIGEVAPALFGRFDLARLHIACATLRNLYVGYQGGAYSRAGTAFVGFSKQTGRSFPPRLIPFQFSINQGLALEFGNFYMRVVSNGAFVTDLQATITAATNANPLVITVNGTGAAAASAVPVNSGISQSYAPADLVTLAGGIFSVPTRLSVTNTLLLNLALNFSGVGVYAPADTIHLTGGTQSTPAVLTVATTQVSGATIAAPGTVFPATWSGATTAIVQGTTGTGIKFQASCQMDVTGLLSVNSISLTGDYTVNPTAPANEPVTLVSYSGGGAPVGVTLTGAQLDITLGVLGFTITNTGVFTANPAGGTFTQASTSGSGTGATFLGALMAPHAVAISVAGSYSTYPSNPVSQASTTGSGIGAQFTVTTTPISLVPFFNAGDWIEISGVGGMTQLNGLTAVIALVAGSSLTLHDVYGNPINSTAFGVYTAGGLASRIFTLTTIYAEADLDYLKFTQSADVMSICCVNQITQTEYPAQDLNRVSDTSWNFTAVVPEPSVLPPTNATGSATSAGSTDYGYVVTAVSPTDGSESIASNIALVSNAVDVASTAGTILITWTPPATPGVQEYNVYKAQPLPGPVPIPGGALYGFAGQAYGASFADNNIVADYAQVPPTHQDPFARGQIQSVQVLTSSGTVTSVTFTFGTAGGTDAVLVPIIVNSVLVQINVADGGSGFEPGDTVNVIVVGGGSATAQLTIGPETGTYPSTVSYFQERRAYANTLNNPDTYYMSQPGAFTNFDTRIPTIDSDAITGSPWSFEVNGIQWMVPTSGGLLVMTGLSAWLLVGTGSFATNVQEISPSSQNVTTQAFSGCSPTVPPIKINYDVIYVEAQGSYYRDLPYQLYALSEPIDITENSSHLFKNYTILQHAWCEQPYKLLWAVRSDGVMLSLTYYKSQQIAGWSRHDTNGIFVSVCSVVEPPNNALYVATQRFPGANTAYMIERMDNRQWLASEDVWAVDAGLSLSQPTPAASLTASSATGLGACTGVTSIATNSGWSAGTTASVIDAPLIPNGPPGPGTGAVPVLTIAGGAITGITFSSQGSGYLNPQLVFNDPAGSQGGSFASAPNAVVTLSNTATFTASAAVFSAPNVGSVIRMGGGIASITAFIDSEHVTANILSPIIDVVPNSGGVVESQPAGSWTMTAPVTVIGGLQHLAGATVTGLADGNVIPPTVVSATGTITLGTPASQVVIGLAFLPQFQTVNIDSGEPTLQGQRKKIPAVTVRLEASGGTGIRMGTNQPDASTQSPMPVSVPWNEGAGGLTRVIYAGAPNRPRPPYNSLTTPLFTGDIRIPTGGGIATTGQVALQQDSPLPMNILSLYPEILPGDTAQTQWPKKQQEK
jgi:hypothetical protein